MAGNIYLYLDGIPGESYADDYVNWIDIDDFSIGVTMAIDQDARTGGGVGNSGAADPQDLECSTKMSAATPVLLHCCATGAIIPRAKLVQCNIVNASGIKDGFRTVVSEYAFGNSILSNVSLSGSGGGIPDQSFSLNYGSIVWRYNYYRHDNPSIQSGSPIERSWSLLTSNTQEAETDGDAFYAMRSLTASEGGYKDLFDAFTGSIEYSPEPAVDASKPSLQKWEEDYL